MYRKSSRRAPWQDLFIHWQQMDWPILIVAVSLTLFGGTMIRSSKLAEASTDLFQQLNEKWGQHCTFGLVGLFIVLIIARISASSIMRWHWVTYGITTGLLVAVMGVGKTVLGAQRWIIIAGFQLQPSEFAKVGLIITLAAILHRRPADTLPTFIRALAITAPPWLLVFIQPDLGTSLVFGAISLGMLYWANANPGWLLLLASPVASAIIHALNIPIWIGWIALMGIVAWFTLPSRWISLVLTIVVNIASGFLGEVFWHILKDYQKARLTVFMDPEADPLGAGYHLIQSRIAIGAGGFWGQGLNQGTQTQLNFIPEQHTDFIFSAIGEELGFVGAICLLSTFLFICWRMVRVAKQAQTNFGSLLVVGVFMMISFQVFVNISMTIGLAPVTGIPLPWISYGRSALLTNFIAIGLVESVANSRRKFNL